MPTRLPHKQKPRAASAPLATPALARSRGAEPQAPSPLRYRYDFREVRVGAGDDAALEPRVPGVGGASLHLLPATASVGAIQRDPVQTAPQPAATRAEKLAAYHDAIQSGEWPEAARRLNGFNDDDIAALVKKLSNAQTRMMRQGSLQGMPGYSDKVVSFLDRYGPVQTEGDDASLASANAIHLQGLKGIERKMAEIYNEKGAYIEEIAQNLGIDAATAAAVLKVESGGEAFGPSGQMIIRFENHVFYKRWGKQNQATFSTHFKYSSWRGNTHFFRETDTVPWQSFHDNQSSEWRVFEFARALDEEAAIKSISMGAGQVMGGNYQKLGYASALEMFDHMSGGVRPQLDDMFTFIKRNPRCLQALQNNDYVRFARYYNGGGQVNAYGGRIRDAADAYRRVVSSQTKLQMTLE